MECGYGWLEFLKLYVRECVWELAPLGCGLDPQPISSFRANVSSDGLSYQSKLSAEVDRHSRVGVRSTAFRSQQQNQAGKQAALPKSSNCHDVLRATGCFRRYNVSLLSKDLTDIIEVRREIQ